MHRTFSIIQATLHGLTFGLTFSVYEVAEKTGAGTTEEWCQGQPFMYDFQAGCGCGFLLGNFPGGTPG